MRSDRSRPLVLTALVALVVGSAADATAQRPTRRAVRVVAVASFDARVTLRAELDARNQARLAVPGSRLDRPLTGLRIESRGRPVPGVQTTVVSRRSDVLVLDVQVDPGTRLDGGSYELVAFDGRTRLSAPVEFVMPPRAARTPRFDTRAALRAEVDTGNRARLAVPGAELDRPLTGHRIESRGRVVPGVRIAEISRSPATLVLEIEVDPGTDLSLGGTYELVAFDGETRLTVPVNLVPPPDPYATTPRIATSRLIMTGQRLPIEVETGGLVMTGLRFPIEVETESLRMTGIREENP